MQGPAYPIGSQLDTTRRCFLLLPSWHRWSCLPGSLMNSSCRSLRLLADSHTQSQVIPWEERFQVATGTHTPNFLEADDKKRVIIMNFGHSIYWFVWIETFLPEPESVSVQEDLLILPSTHVGTGSAVGTWWWAPTECWGMSAFPHKVLSTQTPDWKYLLLL